MCEDFVAEVLAALKLCNIAKVYGDSILTFQSFQYSSTQYNTHIIIIIWTLICFYGDHNSY